MNLHELQDGFIAFLRDEASEMPTQIVEGGRIATARRLHIYHHAYSARLVEVMQDVFERTWAYLGDDGFEDCARQYIQAIPPSACTLNRFGSEFPVWLQSHLQADPEVSEVAMIDWLLRCAFDGADAKPLASSALSQLSTDEWATIGLDFHPTVTVAPMAYNAASIWEAMENHSQPPSPIKLTDTTFLLVWRKGLRPHFVSIGAAEAEAIELLCRGESFASTCEKLAVRHPGINTTQTMGQALRRWLDEEMLTGTRTYVAEGG